VIFPINHRTSPFLAPLALPSFLSNDNHPTIPCNNESTSVQEVQAVPLFANRSRRHGAWDLYPSRTNDISLGNTGLQYVQFPRRSVSYFITMNLLRRLIYYHYYHYYSSLGIQYSEYFIFNSLLVYNYNGLLIGLVGYLAIRIFVNVVGFDYFRVEGFKLRDDQSYISPFKCSDKW